MSLTAMFDIHPVQTSRGREEAAFAMVDGGRAPRKQVSMDRWASTKTSASLRLDSPLVRPARPGEAHRGVRVFPVSGFFTATPAPDRDNQVLSVT